MADQLGLRTTLIHCGTAGVGKRKDIDQSTYCVAGEIYRACPATSVIQEQL